MSGEWTYRVSYDFTGGPTRKADQPPWEPNMYTGSGGGTCDVQRIAPMNEADWPSLGVFLAGQLGYATVTVKRVVEVPS